MPTEDTFDYQLITHFKYADKGEQVEAQFIRFFAPTSKTLKLCSDLKQAFFRSMPEGDPNRKTTAEEVEIDGASVMMMIASSKEVSLAEVLLTARELFNNKEVALVDGEERFTKPLIDELSNDELDEMTGEYLANFILASVLRKMNDKLSQELSTS